MHKTLPGLACYTLGFLMSCCATEPTYNPDIYKIYNQDGAVLLANGVLADEYEIEHRPDYRVLWSDERCPYSEGYAVILEGRCYYGLMVGCQHIYVALSNRDPERTCGSALLHEYGHCWRAYAGWGYDSDHTDDRFWDTVRVAQEIVCDRGF